MADAWSRGMSSPHAQACRRWPSVFGATLSQAGQPAVVPSWPGVACTAPMRAHDSPVRAMRKPNRVACRLRRIDRSRSAVSA